MKKKIKKYLLSKNKHEYSNLDQLLEMYLNNEIKYLLSNYEGVNIYPSICNVKGKLEKTIQICFNYHNIYVGIDFFEDKYNLVIYPSGISVNDLEKLFIDYEYPDDFTLQKLIKDIDFQIKNHSKLRDTTLIKKKKRIYSLISTISFLFSLFINGLLLLNYFITQKDIVLNMWWGVCTIIIPLIVWFVFDIKTKRLK